jgi:hypothetical protein
MILPHRLHGGDESAESGFVAMALCTKQHIGGLFDT